MAAVLAIGAAGLGWWLGGLPAAFGLAALVWCVVTLAQQMQPDVSHQDDRARRPHD